MNLIVETDLGHDPDDFFAICYLIAIGVNIRAVCISAGDPDQIAIARLIFKETGIDVPIGVSHENRTKLSSGSVHHALLKKYGMSLEAKADGKGIDIIGETLSKYPDCEFFVIGPVSSIGKYIQQNSDACYNSATMQGGFLPYSVYKPDFIFSNFEGKEWMPTFNLNGDISASKSFLSSNFKSRKMVGKNVCHTILFEKSKLNDIKPKCRASELFKEAAEIYFLGHYGKKFHDPTAACLHIHPEIGTWIKGRTTRISGGWTTIQDENGDDILADVNRNTLWDYLLNFR